MKKEKIKILFFIGTLGSGGKERRLLELMTYLNQSENFSLYLVTKQTDVMFDNFFKLKVEWISLNSKKLSLGSFFEFSKIVRKINPDFIHTWGNKYTFISIPSKLFGKNIKLINSQITSAPPKLSWSERLISRLNFNFSDIILSNSFAGIDAYNPPKSKSAVIYNGLNFKRFIDLPDKKQIRDKFGISTEFVIVMVASYSQNKDYDRFFKVGQALQKLRNDTSFLGVGYCEDDEPFFKNAVALCHGFPNLIPIPGTSEVEALVNACDIGVLFSNTELHGEGISNAIIECMALGKPVIANDAGGTKEIVKDEWNGYLIQDESPDEIALKIHNLLGQPETLKKMGENSKERILQDFSLKKMGTEFENIYRTLS
ncbi:glycosyltransferase [Aquiflexum sp. LQ15W]|uniref:glycosyltransferase n=1 Tax=Cognataquiflexum nitidum TaxID=2922272 RepID=UPI001F134D82|nr:glycosyltransferase [Cognataquiflexum nitidum]MCH6201427.1 glycosyltransferase [Cognataquiflexum nitidum]